MLWSIRVASSTTTHTHTQANKTLLKMKAKSGDGRRKYFSMCLAELATFSSVPLNFFCFCCKKAAASSDFSVVYREFFGVSKHTHTYTHTNCTQTRTKKSCRGWDSLARILGSRQLRAVLENRGSVECRRATLLPI